MLAQKKISSKLSSELDNLLRNDFDITFMRSKRPDFIYFATDILFYLAITRTEQREYYDINASLNCFIKYSQSTLSDVLIREDKILLDIENEIKEIELKWHKRLFELQIACMMNIGELKEVSFSE